MVFAILDRAADRLEVTVTALGESPIAAAARRWGWPVRVQPAGKGPLDIAKAGLALARRWRRSDDVDVVLANAPKAAAVAVPAARLAGIPVVWMKHDFSHDATLARPLGTMATAVFANSTRTAAACRRPDAVVVSPPRPPAPLPSDEARAALEAAGLPAHARPVVAGVGRLVPYKGFDDLIAAAAQPGGEGWHVAVIGLTDPHEPHEAARLRALAQDLGVADRVHLLGELTAAARLLSGVDAVAVPTKVDAAGVGREGWSMVADEAMAAGVPVIATEGGALADRLGDAGVVVPMDSPAALAHALTQLTPAMGQAGRAAVAAMDDVDATTARFVGALAAAAHRPGAGLAAHDGPPLSIVVPVYREEATIAATLDALAAQLRPGDELVVVVDEGGDGTVAAVQAWPGPATVIVRPGPAGISSARNAGIAAARHAVVACTDAGCRPHPGWVDALRLAAAERPAPALVTGLYDVAATTSLEEAFALACYPVVEEARRTGPWTTLYGKLLGRAFDPTLPTGRSMACTKEAWAAAGGFPEDLATAEDVSFGRRIAEQGGACVLAADAVTTWDQRPTLAATARMYERYGEGDGRSRDRLLVARNLARLAAYAGGPLLAWKGGSAGRAAAAAGAAVYLSVPVARAARRRSRPATWALLPVALVVKDVAKAVGCVKGLLSSRASSRTI